MLPEAGDPKGLAPGPYVHFTIEDTGPGVPANLKDKIFQPFFYKIPGKRAC